ncbi:MAG: metal ABC transporter permease [Methanocorpusculum sp.]|nr:metal ABC transporter permease [Methanocorpusculum sp.]
MLAIFEYQFLQYAVIAALLASIVCGVIGTIIIEKKIIMMSGGIAHTAYGGVGLGYLLGFTPMIGAVIFAVLAAFGVGAVKRHGKVHTDIVIAMLWSLGMALGIAFIGMMPGYAPDMTSYLFGNILSVTKADIILMFVLTCIVVFIVAMLFNDWKSYLFDEQFAYLNGMKTVFLEYLLLVLVALSVVVLIRVAGIILVLALLTAPAACSALLSKNLKVRMIFAVIFGIVFCIAGLALSYAANISSGACIVIISVAAYAVIYLWYILHSRANKAEAQ